MAMIAHLLCLLQRVKTCFRFPTRLLFTLFCLGLLWVCCLLTWKLDQLLCTKYLKQQFIPGELIVYCKSPTCISLANKLHQLIDHSINPCDDFYRFTCGKYINNTIIPQDKTFWGMRSEVDNNIMHILKHELEASTTKDQPPVFQKAKDFYQSCMDTASIEKIGLEDFKERLKNYGGWPVLKNDWNEDSFDWITSTKTLEEAGQPYNLIVAAGLSANKTNVTQSVIVLGPPHQGRYISIDSYYLRNGTEDPVTKAYLELMVNLAVELGADRSEAEHQLMDSLLFEMQIAQISGSMTNMQDTFSRSLKVLDLKKLFPYINWRNYLSAVFGESAKIKNDELVEVTDYSYFQRLGSVLEKTPKRVVANYMLGQVVFSSKRHLTAHIDELNHKLLTERFSLPDSFNRSDFCLINLKTQLTPIMGAIFVQKHLSSKSKQTATMLAKLIQGQLIILLSEVDWLDNVTRSRAVDKIKNTHLFIGYPEELMNTTYLDEYYTLLQFNRSDFYSNILSVKKFYRAQELKELHKSVNTSRWDRQGLSSTVEWMAYNMFTANGLDIYAGILQGFYFDADRPLFLNIASLGAIIAHELTHSIDVSGSFVNKDGNFQDWWEKETRLTFEKKARAIVEEYSTYEVKDLGMKLNGEMIRDEIIADQGGYKIARSVLDQVLSEIGADPRVIGLEPYSAPQLFWLVQAAGWCENMRPAALKKQVKHATHPPAEFRVNGPYRNSPQFAHDWKCPVGSYMNPRKKVNVW